MNGRRLLELMDRLAELTSKFEALDRNGELSTHIQAMRDTLEEMAQELEPPPGDEAPKTRDEISPREWAEYEWVDVTSLGDRQRKYIRGLKR
jgi:hypothetical protein